MLQWLLAKAVIALLTLELGSGKKPPKVTVIGKLESDPDEEK